MYHLLYLYNLEIRLAMSQIWPFLKFAEAYARSNTGICKEQHWDVCDDFWMIHRVVTARCQMYDIGLIEMTTIYTNNPGY